MEDVKYIMKALFDVDKALINTAYIFDALMKYRSQISSDCRPLMTTVRFSLKVGTTEMYEDFNCAR